MKLYPPYIDRELPIKENYNKNRRIHRGLFKSNDGILLNSDVNGSYQILKKVIGDYFVKPNSIKVLQVTWFYIKVSGYALIRLVVIQINVLSIFK